MTKISRSLLFLAFLTFTTNIAPTFAQSFSNQKDIIASIPATGTQKFLVLLVNFSDSSQLYSFTNLKDLFNSNTYSYQGATGSVKKYFSDNSYDQLNLYLNASVLGWLNVSHPHHYYAGTPSVNNWKAFVLDAINAARGAYTSLDFSNYDSNSDGIVDGIFIIHQGQGQEYSGNNNDIYSYLGDMTADNHVFNGKKIGRYVILPEFYGNTRDMQTPGIICHYVGHLLGLPDMTPEDHSNSGIGAWGLMGTGYDLNNGRTPANLTCWEKAKLGWMTPVDITLTPGSYMLKSTAVSNKSYRFNTSTANEYFLLENRQNSGWDLHLPGHGLLIYHVDGNYISSHLSQNTVNNDASHQGLDVEEADGTAGLSSYEGDPFPGSENMDIFTDISIPSAMSWANDTTAQWLVNIAEYGSDSSVYFDFMTQGPADFNCNNRNVAPGDTVSFFDLSANDPDSWAWEFTPAAGVVYVDSIDASKKNPHYRFDNPGFYTVKLASAVSGISDIESKHHFIHVDDVYASINDEVNARRVVVYPVPADDHLFVKSPDKTSMMQISLSDLTGKELIRFDFSDKETIEISTANIQPGYYLVMIHHASGCYYSKVLIYH